MGKIFLSVPEIETHKKKAMESDHDGTLLLPTEKLPCSSAVLDSFWISNTSPSFQGDSVSGSTSMVNFQNSPLKNFRSGGFFPSVDKEENGNEDYDPCFHQPEKKRRLTTDQVRFLEKSFEVENKLEPEKKVQLAKDLGLQPRQVAIWFQNRRARYKTKQLEKDYDVLKASYDKLKADHDSLLKENDKLKNEVQSVKEKVLEEKKGSEIRDPINSVEDKESAQKQNLNTISQNVCHASVVGIKQEDVNSAKSDVLDSDSPLCADVNRMSLFEPVDSCGVFEPDNSDFSHDEEDNFCRILPPPCLPKLKIESYDDLNADPCNLENSVDDQPFWFWPY